MCLNPIFKTSIYSPNVSLMNFFTGNVWVFGAFRPNTTNELAPNFCNASTYYLAFVCIIITYVWLITALCCSSCLACISVYAVSTREKVYHFTLNSTHEHHYHHHEANYSENAEEKKENSTEDKVAETSV